MLTLAGEPPLGWMESLDENAGQMTPSGRLLLASAHAAAGDNKRALSIIGGGSAPAEAAKGGENFDSELRDEALKLLARTYAAPSDGETAAAAASLISRINSGTHISTQEGGFAMAALGRWFAANPQSGMPSGKLAFVSAGGGTPQTETVNAKNRTAQSRRDGVYKAENTGKAPLYAAWTVSYVPSGKAAERDDGIELRQRVTERSGKAVGETVARGAALTASVTLTPKAGTPRSVAVVLPLPAGFEIEEPSLAAAGEETPNGVTFDARDDRLLLFIDRLEKPLTWRYSMRAVTEGDFAVPQVYAECMYEPGVASISGGGRIKVKAADDAK